MPVLYGRIVTIKRTIRRRMEIMRRRMKKEIKMKVIMSMKIKVIMRMKIKIMMTKHMWGYVRVTRIRMCTMLNMWSKKC